MRKKGTTWETVDWLHRDGSLEAAGREQWRWKQVGELSCTLSGEDAPALQFLRKSTQKSCDECSIEEAAVGRDDSGCCGCCRGGAGTSRLKSRSRLPSDSVVDVPPLNIAQMKSTPRAQVDKLTQGSKTGLWTETIRCLCMLRYANFGPPAIALDALFLIVQYCVSLRNTPIPIFRIEHEAPRYIKELASSVAGGDSPAQYQTAARGR